MLTLTQADQRVNNVNIVSQPHFSHVKWESNEWGKKKKKEAYQRHLSSLMHSTCNITFFSYKCKDDGKNNILLGAC